MAGPAPIRRTAVAVAVLIVATLVAVALRPAHSRGQTLASINSGREWTRSKLEHARGPEQTLTTNISFLSGRIRSLGGQIAALQQREAKAQAVLDARRAELARVKARYDAEYARYVRLRNALVKAQLVLANRLVAIYKSDQPDLLAVVMEADGFDDLLVRADYLNRINQQDNEIVGRVKALKQESERKKKLLAALKKQAQAAVAEIAAKRQEL